MECPNCKAPLEDYATSCSSCKVDMVSYAKAEAKRLVTQRKAVPYQRPPRRITPKLIAVMIIVAGLYYYATIPKKVIIPKDELVEEPAYSDDVEGEDEAMDFEKMDNTPTDKNE